MTSGRQTALVSMERGRVMAMDSAYDVCPDNRDRDVVVNASYCGVLPARFIALHRPRASVSVDCGVGPAGSSIAGLWFFEALAIPAAVVDVDTVHLGDGMDVHANGIVSYLNKPAADCGVRIGMKAAEACLLLLQGDPVAAAPSEVTNRAVMTEGRDGRRIVCTDSIAFGLPEDRDSSVLVTAGHTGRSAVPYLEKVHPLGFICSDGGRGRDDAGTAGLQLVEPLGLAGATVDARRARMGDSRSTWNDGVISACNKWAYNVGVRIGMSCPDAALALLEREVPA